MSRRRAVFSPLRWIAPTCALILLTEVAARAADGHAFTAQDLVSMDRVSDPQPSPDGQRVAFVLRTTDPAANRGRTDLWSVAIDGSDLRRLTTHEAGDNSPRWSPDGQFLYFLSTRSGSSQVWRLRAAGGEAEPVTKLPVDVGAFVLSPDGSRLAVGLAVFADCDTLQCTVDRLEAAEKSKASGKLYERLFVRHWDTWADGRRNHVFVVPVAGGDAVDVMKGMDADAPSMPFGGAEEIAFSPDNREVLFTARIAGSSEPWSTNFDLFAAPVDGTTVPRNLTSANRAWDTQPVFSPDGGTLAYLAMQHPGYEADRYTVMLRAWPAGEPRALTASWDRSPSSVVWSADGKTLYAVADHLGQTSVFAIDVASGSAREALTEGSIHALAGAGGTWVVSKDDLRNPADLFRADLASGSLQRITRLNAERVAGIRFGEPEHISFKGANGDTVWAWLVKPVDFDPAKRYPLALLIHGGPQGSFKNEFHYRWNPQIYAGAGFAALAIDFHGSTGYGQAFTDAIRKNWGGWPLEDLKAGVAAALAKNPWIDGGRACALGASYGGFMINWIAGNWFDAKGEAPFRCLVNHDGLFDQRAMYYSTEELWFPEWEQGGPYYEAAAEHEKWNPANFVTRWKTPMLVVHGALDYRVPDTQGIATFTALQRRGIPSRLLYFPDENHWVLKPQNSLQWHETVIGWLQQWTEPARTGRR